MSFAQQDAQYSHYMFNTVYYNPGFVGLDGNISFTGIFRKQWLGYQPTEYQGGSPTSVILSVNSVLPFFKKNSGAGFYFNQDVAGPLSTTQIVLNGSYHLKLGQGKLGIGIKAGFQNQKINGDWYQVVDPNDPIYQSLKNTPSGQMKPDIGLGLYYKPTSQRYYVGVSMNHLSRAKYTYGFDSIASKMNQHMYFTGGYTISPGTNLKITPSVFVQTDFNNVSYLFGGLVEYNSKFWAGLNFRQSFAKREESKGGKTLSNDDVVLYVGLYLLKDNRLRVGYAFDFVTSGVKAKKQTSHEIMLSYSVPAPWAAPKPVIRTPRYRHEEN